MEKHYWIHRIESDFEAAVPLLRRGYLSVGWSRLAAMPEDILGLATMDDQSALKKIVESAYNANFPYTSLKHFASFRLNDIVVVPLADDKFSVFQIKESPISITQCPINAYLDTNNYKITKSDNGLLLRSISSKGPTVVDIGYVAKAELLTAKLPRSCASNELRKMMGLQPTNNNIDRLEHDVESILSTYGGQ